MSFDAVARHYGIRNLPATEGQNMYIAGSNEKECANLADMALELIEVSKAFNVGKFKNSKKFEPLIVQIGIHYGSYLENPMPSNNSMPKKFGFITSEAVWLRCCSREYGILVSNQFYSKIST